MAKDETGSEKANNPEKDNLGQNAGQEASEQKEPRPERELRPFLEKSTSKAGSDRTRLWNKLGNKGKVLWLILILSLISGALYLLVIKPGQHSNSSEVAYRQLYFPELSKDNFTLISGTDSIYERVLKVFSVGKDGQGLAVERLRLEYEIPGQVDTPRVLRTLDNDPTSYSDQLLKLQLLIATGRKQAFRDLEQEIQETFPQYLSEAAEADAWGQQLAYLRSLLLARQFWEDKELDQRILSYSQRLLPLFENGLPAQARKELADHIYPQVSAKDRNEQEEYQDTSLIYLDTVDLWVLESLTAYDPGWQLVFDRWLERIRGGRLDSGFYAYAWDSDQENYIPADSETFRANTLSSLSQAISLYEVGEGRPDDVLLFNQLLASSSKLYDYYNLGSLMPMTEVSSADNLLALQYLGYLAKQELPVDLSRQALAGLLYQDTDPVAQSFLAQTEGKDTYFYFRPNARRILLEAWQEKPLLLPHER
ncbi:MAG: hypothetical protein Q4E09_01430 [Eubacteriales bacterium]|nr:hypothetical protein [Eubacteriales bacterium]